MITIVVDGAIRLLLCVQPSLHSVLCPRNSRTQHHRSSTCDGRLVATAAARVHQCPHHRIQIEGGGLLTRRDLPEVVDLLGYHRPHWTMA